MGPTQYLGARRLLRAALLVIFGVGRVFGVLLRQTQAAEIPRYEPMAPPPISAEAVFVTDLSSGTELFAMNADAPLPPASLTKIVSALVVLERAKLDDAIEILEDDLVSPEESQVGLKAGDRLTVRDLLFGMLIPSGNDATLALARHVGASAVDEPVSAERAVEEFVALMNGKATTLGATASRFANPTGIDSDGHVMSAKDIAVVTAAALQDPLFSEIVGTSSAVLSSEVLPEGYSVTTTNVLLTEGAVTGVKTGTTARAGGCLVTSFAVGPNTVVSVVLGSEIAESADGLQNNTARFADTRAILDAVREEYVWLDPDSPGEVSGLVEELSVWEVDLGTDDLVPVPAANAEEVRYRLVLAPPTEPPNPAGHVQFYVGTRLLSELPALQTR
ncbi:MAG: serine hydrolase [Chloroflexi bacterium]|nr:serine hydrolase [Chloroflexota bacterium]